ncbi:hypothetical protein HMI54_010593 [Coelomomyces lativittatus]|nr:hypothetical protein HMI54_010593 [Coelomomyces lativittatus]
MASCPLSSALFETNPQLCKWLLSLRTPISTLTQTCLYDLILLQQTYDKQDTSLLSQTTDIKPVLEQFDSQLSEIAKNLLPPIMEGSEEWERLFHTYFFVFSFRELT